MCPDKIIPTLKWCKKSEGEAEGAEEDDDDDDDPVSGGRGQILWVRGLTRLQQQVSSSLRFVVACSHWLIF